MDVMATARAARQPRDSRRTRRVTTDVAVGFREQGQHSVATRLLDVSRFGFRVEVHGLVPDSMVWLKLPEADPQMARVVWSDHRATGCVFTETLDVEIFRRTVRTGCTEAAIITGPWKPQAAV
ncbi:MAG TPA: PilZ domain-containing protein [Sphingomonas sp.]|nr:PilZ domain-containing protein [Sphingomonas sp.]